MRVHAARHQARRDIDFQVRIYAAQHRARGIYDGHCHPFRFPGVKGWHRRPAARRRCDRPVGAGRSTALRAVLAPPQTRAGRQIVTKTGTPSADSRAKPEPGPGRQYSFTDRKVADCHRSPSLRHSRHQGAGRPLHILPADSACVRSESALGASGPRLPGSARPCAGVRHSTAITPGSLAKFGHHGVRSFGTWPAAAGPSGWSTWADAGALGEMRGSRGGGLAVA